MPWQCWSPTIHDRKCMFSFCRFDRFSNGTPHNSYAKKRKAHQLLRLLFFPPILQSYCYNYLPYLEAPLWHTFTILILLFLKFSPQILHIFFIFFMTVLIFFFFFTYSCSVTIGIMRNGHGNMDFVIL